VTSDGPAGLELLASAIAATPLVVVPGGEGQASWTDGNAIFVDETLPRRDQLCAVSVQAALIAAGSLGPEIVAGLDRRRNTPSRYLAIEGHRALAAHEEVLPARVRRLIDPAVSLLSDSPAASLALAKGPQLIADAPTSFGEIRPRHIRTHDRAAVADGTARHAPRQTREQVLRELDDGEDGYAGEGFDMLNPVGGGSALGRLLQRMLGNARSWGKERAGAEAATHRTRQGGRVARGAAISSRRVDLTDAGATLRHDAMTYPEWNVFARKYRLDWCTVVEVEPPPDGREAVVGPEVQPLRRSIARLGLDLERTRRQAQGDEIDIDAVVEARAELAAGSAPDEAVYIDNVRRRRELSVMILLDISGSAGEPSGSGGTVHDHQLRAATALGQAVHELGDRVALYGFRSQGRSSVEVVPVKRFGERYDSRTLRRLGQLAPGGYTRLGAAIRHGTLVLEADGGTVRRLLLVLSDGFAYDHGYEGEYGEADARRALAEARRRGVACLCLSIGAAIDADSLRRVFGTAAYASMPRPAQLAATAGPLFRTALRLAETQRRASQRNHRTRELLQVERRSA
jgi:hypothetical protein